MPKLKEKKPPTTPIGHMREHRRVFKVAEKVADEMLFGTAVGLETATPTWDEAFDEVRAAFSDAKQLDRQVDAEDYEIGDVMAQYQISGLLLGLALGLRMRGAR